MGFSLPEGVTQNNIKTAKLTINFTTSYTSSGTSYSFALYAPKSANN